MALASWWCPRYSPKQLSCAGLKTLGKDMRINSPLVQITDQARQARYSQTCLSRRLHCPTSLFLFPVYSEMRIHSRSMPTADLSGTMLFQNRYSCSLHSHCQQIGGTQCRKVCCNLCGFKGQTLQLCTIRVKSRRVDLCYFGSTGFDHCRDC